MFDNRDFTVCENCGGRCYLGNKYCEDCANELLEIEYHINSDYCDVLTGNELLKEALEMACEELNKNIDNLCEYCEYKEQNIWYGSCDCDIQFETDRTINYFKNKAKEKMKNE